jgi:3-phosphoshikimate 1-carboxyvinyltransferase
VLATVSAPRRLEGEVRVPGDKSISHRALILNAVADGVARVRGLSPGADVLSTTGCLRALGVEVEGEVVVGRGLRGLRPPSGSLDCGNSGTTMRLLAGLLAAAPFEVTLVGDASLSRRPMDRVVEPLRAMGARAETDPLRVGGQVQLHGIDYALPVASAQVKSALLLAGLFAAGRTRLHQPAPTRDHTERMLAAMGAPVEVEDLAVSIRGPVGRLAPLDVTVPGDLSAAAFWLVAAALHPVACVRVPAVGVNPTRTALLEVLARIGVEVRRGEERLQGGEPVADLEVGTARQGRAFAVGGAEVAALIDELPVLAVAGAVLPGTTRITGAGELRVKESDRIRAMAVGLAAMGAQVRELPDGWEIRGPRRLQGARVDSFGDHRVAMALAVAGLLADGVTEIEGGECVAISYPGFWEALESLARPASSRRAGGGRWGPGRG